MSTLSLFDPGPRKQQRRGGGGSDGGGQDNIFRVGQLNRLVRLQLEQQFQNIWLQGELSDVSRPASGHVYFTINDEDENAQMRGVLFRSDALRAKAKLENGARIKLRGTLSLFEPRGSYQFIARIALPLGLGDLHAQFEIIRRKLEAEGLLAAERKRSLPRVPKTVGVVTSRSGAALHDIIVVAQQRCPTRIVVAPCLVQGTGAAKSIVSALQAVQELPELDVVIVGRGGGATEDLFAFNDEQVARAIAACRVPTISAVGHEVDVTIADLVADVRAATPSNAAELAVPDRESLLAQLDAARNRLDHTVRMALVHARLRVDQQNQRLKDPRMLSARSRRKLDALGRQLESFSRLNLRQSTKRLEQKQTQLLRLDPRLQLTRRRTALEQLQNRLQHALRAHMRKQRTALTAREQRIDSRQLNRHLTARRALLAKHEHGLQRDMGEALYRRRAQLGELAARLGSLSPLSVLARGYAIALRSDGRALLRAQDVQPGDRIQLRLHEGQLNTRVEP